MVGSVLGLRKPLSRYPVPRGSRRGLPPYLGSFTEPYDNDWFLSYLSTTPVLRFRFWTTNDILENNEFYERVFDEFFT